MKILNILFRFVGVPLLVALYFGAVVPALLKSHRGCLLFDWLFDKTAMLCGWDTKWWPLPRSSDEV